MSVRQRGGFRFATLNAADNLLQHVTHRLDRTLERRDRRAFIAALDNVDNLSLTEGDFERYASIRQWAQDLISRNRSPDRT